MLKEYESVLGLNIEAEGIKIVELRKTAGGLELLRAKILPLPPNSLKEGVVTEPKSIAAQIKEFIDAHNIFTRKTIGLISPSSTLLRLIRIPFMSEPETKAILETEVNHYVDFKHKEKIIDFCLLEEINEEGIKKINVLFAAALKEVVEGLIQVAEEANLELTAIDVSTLAVIRTLYGVNIKSSSTEPVMLVNINKEDIQLCILKSNRLRFLHGVKIDLKEFITVKKEFIDRLLFSVKLALNYYSRAIYGQEEINRMIVSINEPSLKDIDREIHSRLEGLSIEKANHLGRLAMDDSVFPEEEKENINLTFASLIGAVLREEDAADYPLILNLVPLEMRKRSLMNKELNLYASSLTALLAIFVALAGIFWTNNYLMQRRISELNQELIEATASIDKLTRDQLQNLALDKRIDEASRIIVEADKNRSKASSTLLAKTMVLVPEGLWLSEIAPQLQEASLGLTGNAIGEKYIFEYVNSLSGTGYFNKVEPVFSKTQEKTIHFLIKCQLKR